MSRDWKPLPTVPGQEELPLDGVPAVVTPDAMPEATIQERFEAFHAANPWVLTFLEGRTREWLASGRSRLGIGMLTELLRWEYGRQTTGDVFKISNDYRSRYVRLMIQRNPEWREVFVTKTLTAA